MILVLLCWFCFAGLFYSVSFHCGGFCGESLLYEVSARKLVAVGRNV